MQRLIRYLIPLAGVLTLLWSLASCSHDAGDSELTPEGQVTLSLGFRLPIGETTNGYEEGEAAENYIDVAHGNYRIYFFDTDNRFIARFEPDGVVATEGTDYRQYHLLGKAPEALVGHDAFKMVVLANWPQYGDSQMTAGVTTLENVCSASWAQYTYKAGFKPDPQKGQLMPFYGVREYSGVSFRTGQATLLEQPVTLLRAMAKVEVILETDDYFDLSFSELKINHYNAKGYCAPEKVFSQGDYDHNGAWDEDYVRTLHLVGNANDAANDAAERTLNFDCIKRWKEGETVYEQWRIYLPEYKNKDTEAYSSILAKLNIQLKEDTPHRIYFASYSDGKPDNSPEKRLDIERNNIYRFQVKCTGYHFKLLLSVSDWAGTHENIFDFGDGQVVSPVSPWEDEITNNAEF